MTCFVKNKHMNRHMFIGGDLTAYLHVSTRFKKQWSGTKKASSKETRSKKELMQYIGNEK